MVNKINKEKINRSLSSTRISETKKKLFRDRPELKKRYGKCSIIKKLKRIFPDMDLTDIKQVETKLLTLISEGY